MESGGGQRRPAGLGPAIFGWPFAPTGRGIRPSCLVGWRQYRRRFTHRPDRGCPGFAVSAAPRIGRLVCCSNRPEKGLFLVGTHHPGATDVYMQSDEGPDLSRHGLVRSPNLASPLPHWMSPEAVLVRAAVWRHAGKKLDSGPLIWMTRTAASDGERKMGGGAGY